jgi:hypothetical protein
MKRPMKLFAAVAVVLLAGLWTATSDGAVPKRTEKGAPKPELYTVIQVGDEAQVIKKSELTNLRKTIAEEDKQKKKDYDEAKKAAAKSKEKTDLGKPPLKRTVKVLKDSFKTEEEAKDWMEKHPVQKKKTSQT